MLDRAALEALLEHAAASADPSDPIQREAVENVRRYRELRAKLDAQLEEMKEATSNAQVVRLMAERQVFVDELSALVRRSAALSRGTALAPGRPQ